KTSSARLTLKRTSPIRDIDRAAICTFDNVAARGGRAVSRVEELMRPASQFHDRVRFADCVWLEPRVRAALTFSRRHLACGVTLAERPNTGLKLANAILHRAPPS